MDALRDAMWLVWIGAALVAGLIEVASLDFVFAMLVGGALSASAAAGLGYSFTVQAITFAIVSGILLVTVRPLAKRWAVRNAPFVPTNVDALAGRIAEILTEVTDRGGTVKLTGETWSARSADAGAVLQPGTLAEVVAIDGATAVVRPRRPTEPDRSPDLP